MCYGGLSLEILISEVGALADRISVQDPVQCAGRNKTSKIEFNGTMSKHSGNTIGKLGNDVNRCVSQMIVWKPCVRKIGDLMPHVRNMQIRIYLGQSS